MRRALLVLPLLLLGASCGPSGPPPDVVLVVVDTLRADRTTAVEPSLPTTPRLAELGARGAVYRAAVAPGAWTLPSMAGLFAGREVASRRHGAFGDVPALAERFAAAGYRTVGLVANPLLTEDNGFARGFEEYAVAPAASTTDLEGDLSTLRAWDAEALVAKALRAAAADDPRPLFLYLHLMDPHVPYDPANDRLMPALPGWSEDPGVPWEDALETPMPDEHRAHLAGWRRAYDGAVAFADRALGRMLARFDEVRARPRLVAVTSDHGEGLFSHLRNPDNPPDPDGGPLATGLAHGYHDHGEQVYEEALRVPLWLAGPGVPAGYVETRPVATRALGATLLELAGLEADGPRLPLSPDDPVPDVIAGIGSRDWFVRTADAKLAVPFPERADRPGVETRVYAMERGAAYAPEDENLAGALPEATAALIEVFEAWRAEHADQRPQEPDAATLERLEQLGYVK